MPEAAELETLRRQLLPYLPMKVSAAVVRGHRSVRRHPPELLQNLVGSELTDVVRRGKWLGLVGAPHGMLVHLRMSGRLHIVEPATPLNRHDHVALGVESHGRELSLRFFDPRTFGEVALWDGTPLGTTAADVLDPMCVSTALHAYTSKRAVKTVLLDQAGPVQGLGNIYVDEACHLVEADPGTPWSSLSRDQLTKLATVIPELIEEATQHRGTALADEGWLDLHQQLGGHGPHLHVHGRKSCADCGGAVDRTKVSGRSTYVCRACLAPKRPA